MDGPVAPQGLSRRSVQTASAPPQNACANRAYDLMFDSKVRFGIERGFLESNRSIRESNVNNRTVRFEQSNQQNLNSCSRLYVRETERNLATSLTFHVLQPTVNLKLLRCVLGVRFRIEHESNNRTESNESNTNRVRFGIEHGIELFDSKMDCSIPNRNSNRMLLQSSFESK